MAQSNTNNEGVTMMNNQEISKLTGDLKNVQYFLTEYPQVVDGYFYSNERKKKLNKNIRKYEKYRETLQNIVTILDNKRFVSDDNGDSTYITSSDSTSSVVREFLDPMSSTSHRKNECSRAISKWNGP